MTAANFEPCLIETLGHEGGEVDHPDDPGGYTNRGITLHTFRRFYPGATRDHLRNVTHVQIMRIYRNGFWNKVRGDDLPNGLDLVAFDGGVNSGPPRGAKWLQRALKVSADGAVGRQTINAAWDASDRASVVTAACRARMGFLRGLGHWKTFGRGWSRRVASVEAVGIAMTGSGAERLREDAVAARKRKSGEASVSGGTAAGGGGLTLLDIPMDAVIALIVGVAILALIFARRAAHEKDRHDALLKQAEKEAV